jgi:transcription-repair coupling factor (superfamily II helicase)
MSIQRLSSILPKNVQDSLNWGSLYGSSDALVLSEFIENNLGVFLVITNTIDQCENLYNSLRFFSGHQIIKFDDWEILPYDHFSPHSEIISNRLEALSLIRKAKNAIVVTTVEALLARICPIDFVSNQMIQLSIGTQLEQTEFSQNLANTGYRKVMKVVEPGEYSVKGSLIDLFPNGSISPYRIDLFDNEIESIRIFDPSTQRTISETESINLTSSKEFPADKESILDFVKKYKAISNRETDQVIDQLENNRLPGGIEFYLSLFFDKTNSLFDYFHQLDGVFTYQGFEDFKNNAINEINTRFEISK